MVFCKLTSWISEMYLQCHLKFSRTCFKSFCACSFFCSALCMNCLCPNSRSCFWLGHICIDQSLSVPSLLVSITCLICLQSLTRCSNGPFQIIDVCRILGNFVCVFVICRFLKNYFFKKFIQQYHQCVEQF